MKAEWVCPQKTTPKIPGLSVINYSYHIPIAICSSWVVEPYVQARPNHINMLIPYIFTYHVISNCPLIKNGITPP